VRIAARFASYANGSVLTITGTLHMKQNCSPDEVPLTRLLHRVQSDLRLTEIQSSSRTINQEKYHDTSFFAAYRNRTRHGTEPRHGWLAAGSNTIRGSPAKRGTCFKRCRGFGIELGLGRFRAFVRQQVD
jgi:hypothetical protein